MINTLIRIIYPNLCRSCQKTIYNNAIFCPTCYGKIKFVAPLFLPLTERLPLNVYAASAYQPPIKNLILKKFSHETLACKQLANLMFEFIPFDVIKPDYLIPIPLHWTRFAWRGYNQSNLIAVNLSRHLEIPVLDILKRNRRTIFQSKLSAQARQSNLANAFSLKNCPVSKIRDKNLVIIDDLFTSGATIKNAAKILVQLKPSSITAAVACRTI